MELSGLHALANLPPRNNPGTHWIGGYLRPRPGLDIFEKRKISFPYRDLNPEPPD
jgi:hypothetical protein